MVSLGRRQAVPPALAMQLVLSYCEGALKNHQQLLRTSGTAPFVFQALDEGGLLGSAPLIVPHKSLGPH